MEIPLHAEVHCTDGPCGHTDVVVIHRKDFRLTHVVIDMGSDVKVLAPTAMIAASTPAAVHLSCSQAELQGLAPFTQKARSKLRDQATPTTIDGAMAQSLDEAVFVRADARVDWQRTHAIAEYSDEELIPEDCLVVHRKNRLEATDDDNVGHVVGFVANPEDHTLSQVIAQTGRLFSKRTSVIAFADVRRMDDDLVQLKLDKHGVAALPEQKG